MARAGQATPGVSCGSRAHATPAGSPTVVRERAGRLRGAAGGRRLLLRALHQRLLDLELDLAVDQLAEAVGGRDGHGEAAELLADLLLDLLGDGERRLLAQRLAADLPD